MRGLADLHQAPRFSSILYVCTSEWILAGDCAPLLGGAPMLTWEPCRAVARPEGATCAWRVLFLRVCRQLASGKVALLAAHPPTGITSHQPPTTTMAFISFFLTTCARTPDTWGGQSLLPGNCTGNSTLAGVE